MTLKEHDAMECRACGREERASEGYPCANCGTFICLICTFRGVTSVASARPAPRRRRVPDSGSFMPAAIARAAIAPVLAEPRVRAEQVTQLVLGETAAVVDRTGDWRRVCTHVDGYDGWVNAGYLSEVEDQVAEDWRSRATAWSEGATLRIGGCICRCHCAPGWYWSMMPWRCRMDDGDALPRGASGR